jgi:hypothetical protein
MKPLLDHTILTQLIRQTLPNVINDRLRVGKDLILQLDRAARSLSAAQAAGRSKREPRIQFGKKFAQNGDALSGLTLYAREDVSAPTGIVVRITPGGPGSSFTLVVELPNPVSTQPPLISETYAVTTGTGPNLTSSQLLSRAAWHTAETPPPGEFRINTHQAPTSAAVFAAQAELDRVKRIATQWLESVGAL